jgi:hypothetical protein
MEVGSNRFWVARPDLCTATVHSPDGVVTVIQFDQPLTSDDAGFSVSGFELRIAEESDW